MMKRIIFLSPLMGFSQNPLFIPNTLSGGTIELNLDEGELEFYNGFSTNTIGYNQDILGPTLILEKRSAIDY